MRIERPKHPISAKGKIIDGIEYKYNNGSWSVVSCDDKKSHVEIKKEIEGSPVTSIGYGAFSKCESLINIIIPDSVTNIDDCAFNEPFTGHGCINLKNVEIPTSTSLQGNLKFVFWGCNSLRYYVYDNAYYLGNSENNYVVLVKAINNNIENCIINKNTKIICFNAFSGCNKLANIEIPSGVTSIGERAFSSCASLKTIIIPNSVISIGYCAFDDCDKVETIIVDKDNPVYDSRDNCNAIIETKTNTLVLGCKNTKIPISVTSIGEYAFFGCKLLKNIEIPSSVTLIGPVAFSGCERLKNIKIPSSVTSIGEYAFEGCKLLTNVIIPNSVISIGEFAFSECESLTNIIISNSVTSIESNTFYGCKRLKTIRIPRSVSQIETYAFDYSLETIIVDKENPVYDSRDNCNAIIETKTNTLVFGCKNTKIPSSVTSIGERAFSSCKCLTSLEIPNSVISISDDAFFDCDNLTSIKFHNKLIYVKDGFDVDDLFKAVGEENKYHIDDDDFV